MSKQDLSWVNPRTGLTGEETKALMKEYNTKQTHLFKPGAMVQLNWEWWDDPDFSEVGWELAFVESVKCDKDTHHEPIYSVRFMSDNKVEDYLGCFICLKEYNTKMTDEEEQELEENLASLVN